MTRAVQLHLSVERSFPHRLKLGVKSARERFVWYQSPQDFFKRREMPSFRFVAFSGFQFFHSINLVAQLEVGSVESRDKCSYQRLLRRKPRNAVQHATRFSQTNPCNSKHAEILPATIRTNPITILSTPEVCPS